MKKSILAFLAVLVTLAGPAFGREIEAKDGPGSLSLKTLTEFGFDFDHPERYGFKFSVPELALTLDLFGYQKVTNRLKSDDPVGFIDLTLGQVQIRFANLSQPDYNNPGQNMMFGFNDSAAGGTGYFSPLYIQNVRTGILWGDWIIQLGSGGTDYFWDPWHREATGYGFIASSWAYLDTRVQYQRKLVPDVIKTGLLNADNYWQYDSQSGNKAYGIDELSESFSGAAVGLQYNGAEFSTMFKVGTEFPYDETAKVTPSKPNGVAFGLDYSYTPTSLKGFRIMSSLVSGFNQVTVTAGTETADKAVVDKKYIHTDLNSVSGGLKVGYDMPLAKSSLKINSIEPYVGIDAYQPLSISGLTGNTGLEGSAGFTLHWPGMNGWGYDYLQGPEGRSGNVYSGATFAYKAYLPNASDTATLKNSLQLTWYNDEDGGLVNNFGSELVAQWFDFTNGDGNNKLMVTSYLGYNQSGVLGGVLVPWTKVYYDNFKLAGMTDRGNNLMVLGGLKLKKAIRNTEFGLTYQSRNLVSGSASVDTNSGFGTFGLIKVSVLISL